MSLDGAVPWDDRGLTLGDGLFETLLARGGQLVAFEAHLARLVAGCGVLGLPAPEAAAARQACEAALAEAGLGAARAAVRLTLTAGSGGRGLDRPPSLAPRLFATAAAAPRPATPARLAIAATRRNDASPAARLKTLAYLDNILARREAQAAGADEAVMLNTRGEVACAAVANLIWRRDGRLFTPALGCGVLDGIVRRGLLAAARDAGEAIAEVAVGRAALDAADAIVLTNSLVGVRPVDALDGRALQSGELAETLARLVEPLIQGASADPDRLSSPSR
ncbi:aminotransferase class IV [Caulobacter sp. KR2-114]|uniref:aminotransferase class IV n=1 Tax=Caulobacter sp. KR2-114 TaxID=3400912 RepID=UPI003C066948